MQAIKRHENGAKHKKMAEIKLKKARAEKESQKAEQKQKEDEWRAVEAAAQRAYALDVSQGMALPFSLSPFSRLCACLV